MHAARFVLSVLLAWTAALPAAVERLDDQPLPDRSGTGEALRFSIQRPVGPAAQRLPLLILFHGTNLTAAKEVTWTDEVLQAMGARESCILLAPQGGTGDGPWRGRTAEIALLIAWAKRTLPIDQRRIVLAGFSAGGSFILHDLLPRHRAEIAGAISFAGGMAKPLGDHRPTDPDLVLTMGTEDKPEPARAWTAAMRALGHRVIYREVIGAGHGTVLGLPNTRTSLHRRDLITWAFAQRCRAIAPPAADLALLQRSARTKASPTDPASRTELQREAARIGGVEAGQLMRVWLSSTDPALRSGALALCQTQHFDGSLVDLLTTIAQAERGPDGQAAAHALGQWAAWRFTSAREALVQLAASSQAQTQVAAASGLGRSVAFTFYGQHEDRSQFLALAGLLDDGDQPVRAAAWTALNQTLPPINPGEPAPRLPRATQTVDPSSPPAGQVKAVRAWTSWAKSLPEAL